MRRFVFAPEIEDGGPEWRGGSPLEQGYHVMPIPKLRRPDAKNNEYYVYSNDTEYKAVEAESAMAAVAASQIPSPLKVLHMHVRLADVIDPNKLEYIGKETGYLAGEGFAPLVSPEIPAVSENPAGAADAAPPTIQ